MVMVRETGTVTTLCINVVYMFTCLDMSCEHAYLEQNLR